MASNTINLNTYRAKLLSNTYGANNSPIYFNVGVPTILTTIGGEYEPVWVDNGVIKAITAGTTAQFYRGDKSWSNALTGEISIGSRGVTSGPSSITYSNRITIVPYFHTGGPWYIKSGDDASNAYLALYYNTTQLMRIKHDGTQMVDWKGNANTASKWYTARTLTIGGTGKSVDGSGNVSWSMNEIMGSSDSSKFYRGDKTWSNSLTGDLNLTGTLTFTATGTTGTSGKITWSGSTDAADIYYYVPSSDQGNLIINTRDDTNCLVAFAYNGTIKAYINNSTPSFYPATTNTGTLGTSTSEWNTTYTRVIYARHFDASYPYTSDRNMYYGYNKADNHYFYTMNGTTRTHRATLNDSFTMHTGNISASAGSIWAGTNGNTAAERDIGAQSGAGQIYLWSAAATGGDRGLYLPAHGTGSAFAIIRSNTNNSVTILGDDVWGASVRINSNWIGFYNARQGGTRYGYIQANADRMYFRKENGVSSYAFDFNGYIYTNNNIYATGTMYADGTMNAHGIWANRATGERQVGVDAGTTGTLYLYSNGSSKGIYSSTGYRTGAVLTINSSSTTFYGALSGNASTATKLATARAINGTNFDGSAAITTSKWGTARTINGSSIDGSANVTTANWGTSRTLTVGNKGQSVNGSGNVSWALQDVLIRAGNEFNFTASGMAGIWFNYRNQSGSNTTTKITNYYFGNGQTGTAGVTVEAENFKGNAATASKLGTANKGSATQPIYLSGGTPTACTVTSSGAYKSAIPFLDGSGVMEIGPYIDFHAATNNTSDYSVRLIGGANSLTVQGTNPKTVCYEYVGTTHGRLLSSNGVCIQVQQDKNCVLYDAASNVLWATWTASSKRIKDNIQSITNDELNNFEKLNVVSFTYKPEMKMADTSKQYGLIAEELIELYPNLVTIPENYKEEEFNINKGWEQPLITVKYEGFIPLLIKMVQNQQKEIEELKKIIQKQI